MAKLLWYMLLKDRNCINPYHLQLLTPAENVKEALMWKKKWIKKLKINEKISAKELLKRINKIEIQK